MVSSLVKNRWPVQGALAFKSCEFTLANGINGDRSACFVKCCSSTAPLELNGVSMTQCLRKFLVLQL